MNGVGGSPLGLGGQFVLQEKICVKLIRSVSCEESVGSPQKWVSTPVIVIGSGELTALAVSA